jgi:hypothetical protein
MFHILPPIPSMSSGRLKSLKLVWNGWMGSAAEIAQPDKSHRPDLWAASVFQETENAEHRFSPEMPFF